jgi:gluconolactonase
MLRHTVIGLGLIFILALVLIGQQAPAPPQRGAAPPREPKIVRIDPAFDAIAPANAQIEKVAGGFGFVEGPVWTRQGSLLLSDIPGNAIMRVGPAGQTSVFRQPIYYGTGYRQGFHIGSNGLTLDREGRVVIAEHGNRRVTRLEITGELTVLADKVEGKRLNSPNDVVVKSDGSIYFTDPPYGLPQQNTDPAKEIPYSGVYRIQNGKVELLTKDVQWPNGIGFSPDERFLYVANSDPMNRVWMRFPVQANGTLGAGAPFYTVPADGPGGIPDGLKLDTLGNLYGTGPGGIWVISPDGKLLGRFEPPEVAANVAWGDDGKTLYMTARTSLYRVRLNVGGKQPCC